MLPQNKLTETPVTPAAAITNILMNNLGQRLTQELINGILISFGNELRKASALPVTSVKSNEEQARTDSAP